MNGFIILGIAVVLALLIFIMQRRMVENKQDKIEKMMEEEKKVVRWGVWQSVKFGFGFAIGVTLWMLVVGVVMTLFFGSTFKMFTADDDPTAQEQLAQMELEAMRQLGF